MRLVALLVAALFVIGAAAPDAPAEESSTVTSLSGRTFRAIEVAVRELVAGGTRIEPYEIAVTTSKDTTIVTFLDPEFKSWHGFGSGPNLVTS